MLRFVRALLVATACSSGGALDAKTPDVAQAERWSATASAGRQQERQPQPSQEEHTEVSGRQGNSLRT